MLTIANLTYRIAGRMIFDNASAQVMGGWKVGLVGPNGAGKSTLFKLIVGELAADAGEVLLSDRLHIGWVKQDVGDVSVALMDAVLAADEERATLLHLAETETDAYALADIHTRLNDIDAYAAPARAAAILSGLGFKDADFTKPLSDFSGGWRMRVALAAALFRQPDFLLLDEPTNHLDLEAVMWLENYLANYPHTLIVISHDRQLLNLCTDHILHVENKELTLYSGNYDQFEKERAEKLNNQQKLYEKQKAQREKMEAFIARFRAKATKAAQAQSRLKALEKMDVVDAVMADRTTRFVFADPESLPPPLITINHVDIGYALGKPVLSRVHERIDMDDRIALLGANGNGKSTLMKLLAGRLAPQAGEVVQSSKVRIGYFAQHQTEELDVRETPYQVMMRQMPGKKEADIRAKLGQFGFGKTLADNPIGHLSGGEKARLLFALISQQAPHVLLLDEPTNHLDMDAREALVQALNAYTGAVVIVSHDPSMIERVADRLWLLHDGQCQPFDGDVAAYRNHVLEQRRQEKRASAKNAATATVAQPSRKEKQRREAEKRKKYPAEYATLQQAEKELERLTKKRQKLDEQLADPSMYEKEAELQQLHITYGHLLRDIDEHESTWLELQEAYDSLPS